MQGFRGLAIVIKFPELQMHARSKNSYVEELRTFPFQPDVQCATSRIALISSLFLYEGSKSTPTCEYRILDAMYR